MVAIVAGIGIAGATGVIRAANARTSGIERVDGLDGVLATPDGQPLLDASGNTINLDQPVEYSAENYLLVGSDSREGFADEAFIGSEEDVGGHRSDTIMILHQERNGGAALVSVPRDLWVPIHGTDDNGRVNSAFNDGPLTLVATVSDALDIPIHHYVEVDFVGFKNIIDRIGGVEMCVELAARDVHSGLALQPGCQTLDGTMALAFARSRYYEVWNGDDWVTDGRADLGRIERQQLFLRTAVDGALRKLQSSPFSAGETIQAVVDSVKIDGGLDPLHAAQVLRHAFEAGMRTYALPVYDDTVGDAAVLRLEDSAEPLLAYLRGTGPAPAEFDTSAVTGGAAPTTAPVTAATMPEP
jgi:LCP family protein required for cell wall assembly